jgi:hypothetical protein
MPTLTINELRVDNATKVHVLEDEPKIDTLVVMLPDAAESFETDPLVIAVRRMLKSDVTWRLEQDGVQSRGSGSLERVEITYSPSQGRSLQLTVRPPHARFP